MLQLSCLAGLDVVAFCNGSCGGGGPCVLHSELCCPTDSLNDDDTVVVEIIQDEQLLKDLAVAASLPPTTTTGQHHHNENIQAVVAPPVVVPTGKRSWSLSLSPDMMASIPTRRRSPNNNRRRGNGVRQPQGLVPRRGPRSNKRIDRACGRCDSTETPHWRTGPDGPGTLCNACGIRYTREQCKLLQLLPEYRRPSASQTKKA